MTTQETKKSFFTYQSVSGTNNIKQAINAIYFLKPTQKGVYIKGGQVVNHDGSVKANVFVCDGGIKYVGDGSDFAVPADARVIDATDRLVIPGGIDPHTHFQFPFCGAVAVDDFYYGTRAAISGGTTTISKYSLAQITGLFCSSTS